MPRLSLRNSRLAIVAMSILAATGCSLLVNTNNRAQCQTTADCTANPLWSGRVCELGFCAIKGQNPDLVSTDGGGGCVTTALCTQQNSGRASVCKKAGTPCVPWEIDGECLPPTGDWQNPDAIMVGSVVTRTNVAVNGAVSPVKYGIRVMDAIDMAVLDFRDKIPGGLQVGGKTRPIALLQCDSRGELATAQERFNFLTDVVGAQAVIVGGTEDYYAIGPIAAQKKIAMVCADCLVPFAPNIAPWKITPPITLDAPLVSWRVLDLETKIKARVNPPPPTAIKVAVVTDPINAPKVFFNELLKTLAFNGKSAGDNGTAGFLPIEIKPVPDIPERAQDIAKFEPDIVIVAMAANFPTKLLPAIEEAWHAGKPRPHYIVTQLSYEVAPFKGQLATDELRLRISGTHPRMSKELRSNVTSFESRFRIEYSQEADGNYGGYDGMYAMAYAIAAATSIPHGSPPQDEVMDGDRINAGFAKLVSGPTINVGPDQISAGVSFLLAPAPAADASIPSINLRGMLSELDWDPQTRAVVNDMSMFCIGSDKDVLFLNPDAGDVVYSVKTGLVTGTYSCD